MPSDSPSRAYRPGGRRNLDLPLDKSLPIDQEPLRVEFQHYLVIHLRLAGRDKSRLDIWIARVWSLVITRSFVPKDFRKYQNSESSTISFLTGGPKTPEVSFFAAIYRSRD